MARTRGRAVVYAVDLEAMSGFYVGTCGLRRVPLPEDESFVQLESDAWELTLVRVPDDVARQISTASPPVRRIETPIKLAFDVEGLERARGSAKAAGGVVDPPEAEWAWQGVWVCDGQDPEGNVVQFRSAARH